MRRGCPRRRWCSRPPRPADVLHRRQIEHQIDRHLLQDRTQPRAPVFAPGLSWRSLQRLRPPPPDPLLPCLTASDTLDESVFRLGQYLDQGLLVEFHERSPRRAAADELGKSPYLMRSSGSTVLRISLMSLPFFRLLTSAPKPMPLFSERLRMIFSRPSNAPPQMTGCWCVHLHEVLLGCCGPPWRRHRRDRPFDQLEQRLLHAFAGDVPGDRGLSDLREILSISSM